jgi:hypothetical protein
MPRLPIPFSNYPRNEKDLATFGERLGGTATMVVGPRTENADGTKGKPEFIEWWLTFEKEKTPTKRPAPTSPKNLAVRDFLKALAKRSAAAWVERATKAKGW